MILLLGGTSETATIASSIAAGGLGVLVSTASDTPLDVGEHPSIARRSGPLDLPAMEELIRQRDINVVVDVTHPYAVKVRATARAAASATRRPYLTFIRPSALKETDEIIMAADHASAAQAAFGLGGGVLLTSGAGNLQPYVKLARETGLRLVVRVLDRPQSMAACEAAGLTPADIIAGRGPFDVEANRQHIRYSQAGVIVTKDGGQPSGLRDKLTAAKLQGCRVVVVARPGLPAEGNYQNVDALIEAVFLAAGR